MKKKFHYGEHKPDRRKKTHNSKQNLFMNFFSRDYHGVLQHLDVEVVFTFPSPSPMQVFTPSFATFAFVYDGTIFKGEVNWLRTDNGTMFAETIPFNETRIGIERGAFAVATNYYGVLMFEFITENARISGVLNKLEESIQQQYSPDLYVAPTLEEIAEHLKHGFRPR